MSRDGFSNASAWGSNGTAPALHHQVREAEIVSERPLDVVGAAHRVDRAVATGDRAERRLALAQPHLVAPVHAFAIRPVLSLKAHLAAHVRDVRIGEVAHELAQRIGRPDGVRVTEREDLAVGFARGAVERRQLPGALAAEQTDVPVLRRLAFDDRVCLVLGAVRRDDDLELLGGIVELEQVLEPPADHVLLVVRGDDQAHGRRDLLLAHLTRAQTAQTGGRDGITDVRPREPAETRPENSPENHARTVLATRRYAGKKPSVPVPPSAR